MKKPPILIVGAGIGGLIAAIELASIGEDVMLMEMATTPGGKMRQVRAGGANFDAGPTVMTMVDVFEETFAHAGARLQDYVTLTKANVLARHAWREGERLDLFADLQRSAQAIGEFSGADEARAFERFCAESARIYQTLERSYMRASRPNVAQLARRVGPSGLLGLARTRPMVSLWNALGRTFKDPRLRQLFARYATYCGSSPLEAPATLMLIAHVEMAGVWLIEGGMYAMALALAKLAAQLGVDIRYNSKVSKIATSNAKVSGVFLENGAFIAASAIIVNADTGALAAGLFGPEVASAAPPTPYRARTLSAMTFAIQARTSGFPLTRHNVFFQPDYGSEFRTIFEQGRIPDQPTVYVCAQDRDGEASPGQNLSSERLFCLINAPPNGDTHIHSAAEIERCQTNMTAVLARCGLLLEPQSEAFVTTPSDFNQLFPATGGALYGRASHGWMASFTRMGARSQIPGLYLAGGSVHPGAGVPMAALSGRLAASQLMADRALTTPSPRAAMSGGILTQ